MNELYKEIEEASKGFKSIDIKGKEYIQVNQRIKAFRMVYPNAQILTEFQFPKPSEVIFVAKIYDESGKCLATGTAWEKEESNFINKTSYIENCETSAIGRALGILGIGIDTSIASTEEVVNAVLNQPQKATTSKNEQVKSNTKPSQFANEKGGIVDVVEKDGEMVVVPDELRRDLVQEFQELMSTLRKKFKTQEEKKIFGTKVMNASGVKTMDHQKLTNDELTNVINNVKKELACLS